MNDCQLHEIECLRDCKGVCRDIKSIQENKSTGWYLTSKNGSYYGQRINSKGEIKHIKNWMNRKKILSRDKHIAKQIIKKKNEKIYSIS